MVLKWQYNGASFFFIRFVNLETKGNKIFFLQKIKMHLLYCYCVCPFGITTSSSSSRTYMCIYLVGGQRMLYYLRVSSFV